MKPRWWFRTREAGWRGLVGLGWLAGALVVSGLWYWVELKEVVKIAGFGGVGMEIAKEFFPGGWFLGAAVLMVAGGIIYGRSGENYKKTAGLVAIITVLVLVLLTTILTVVIRMRELELLLWFI